MADSENFPNELLDAVCELIEEWDISAWAAGNLAKQIPSELEARQENRDEAAYEAHQERLREAGGPDDSHYRKQMMDAGRGHLLR